MAAKKILMLVGDFVEDYEVMVPFQALLMVGTRSTRSARARSPGRRSDAVHDFEGDQTYSEKPGHDFALNCSFDEVKESGYDALVIRAGGRPSTSPEPPRDRDRQALRGAKKPIAAICHGAQVLRRRGRRGAEVQRLPACGPDVTRAAGSTRHPGRPGGDGRRPRHRAGVAAHPAWLAQFLKCWGPGSSSD